jgi:hypothetical protein
MVYYFLLGSAMLKFDWYLMITQLFNKNFTSKELGSVMI